MIPVFTLLCAQAQGDAARGLDAFSSKCFSPLLTAETAPTGDGLRVDFYDLDPFRASNPIAEPQSATTPGTNRRCEVAFDGDHGHDAANVALAALRREGILAETALPQTHERARLPGTTLLGARRLNPKRVAVVHTGTRPGPNGTETFLNVERLTDCLLYTSPSPRDS